MSNVQVLRLILEFSLLPRLSRGAVIDVPSLHYHFLSRVQVMIMISTPRLFSSAIQLSDEELSTILIKYSKNLKIGHININSVAGFKLKFFELKSLFLRGLFDTMVISECQVDHSFPDSHFYIKGFRLHRKDRDRFGDGVFIYARRGLIVTRMNDLERHRVESISLCVQTSRRAKKVLVIEMYRSPGLLKATREREINSILLRSTQRYESIMLTGDLNCDLSRPDKGAKDGKTLMDLMDVYGLTNLTKVPTRVVAESSSLIDVILTNKPRSVVTSGVFDLGLSDHNLIYTVLRLYCSKFSPRTVVKRHLKHYDPGLFLADIATVPFPVAHIIDDPEDVCWAWGKLLSDALDVHVPVKRCISKSQHVPFMTPELLGSIRHRNKSKETILSVQRSWGLGEIQTTS